jgi:hypothetical protein
MQAASSTARQLDALQRAATPNSEGSTLFRSQTSSLLSSSATLQAAHTVVEDWRKLCQGRNQAMFRR